jgi:hypothetical protein
MTDERAHWENTYSERTPEKVSWCEPRPQRALELIQAFWMLAAAHRASQLTRRLARHACHG